MSSEDPFGERLTSIDQDKGNPGSSEIAPSMEGVSAAQRFEDGFGDRLFQATHLARRRYVLETEVNHEVLRADVRYRGSQAPMVVFCPDFPGDHSNKDLESEIFARGISTAFVDYRGMGDSEGTFSFSGAEYDLSRIVEDLREKFSFPREEIAIIGEGYGSYFALNLANSHNYLHNLVSISGISDLRTYISDSDLKNLLNSSTEKVRGNPEHWYGEHLELLSFNNPTDRFGYVSPSLSVRLGDGNQSIDAPESSPLDIKTMIEHLQLCNLLVVHGSADTIVNPGQSMVLYETSPCPHKELKIIDGADHVYRGKRVEMIKAVADHLTNLFFGGR